MYEINEGVQLSLKDKITPNILKMLDSLGLVRENEAKNFLDNLLGIFIEEDKLRLLIDTMFVTDGKTIDYGNVDLGVIFSAYNDFFIKLVGKLASQKK